MPTVNRSGVAYFVPYYVLNRPWFNGAFFESGLAVPARWQATKGLNVLNNLAGGTILQRMYTGEKAPSLLQPHPFDMSWLVASKADLDMVVGARALGEAFQFCAGFRVADTFPYAVSGQNYTLSRPCALGTVPGIDDTYYNCEFYLNGTLDPTAGDVTGQTFASAATGSVTVHYTPLHYVYIADHTFEYTTFNKLMMTLKLNEHITGDFG